jgi:DNA-binding beta-propeller fold protein YncE
MRNERKDWRRWNGRVSCLVVAIGVTVVTIFAAGPGALGLGHPAALPAIASSSHPKCVVGLDPNNPAYDPLNHYVYVPNSGSSNVSVLSGTCTHVASIALPSGSGPETAVYDPANNYVYVTDVNLNQVYVISGIKLIDTITGSIFDCPFGAAVDLGAIPEVGLSSGTILVGDECSGTIVRVSGLGTEGGFANLGSFPISVAYDPSADSMITADYKSNLVEIISVILGIETPSVASFAVGSNPDGVAFDYANGYDYVTNYGSDNVSVIQVDGALEAASLQGTISLTSAPVGAVWSQKALEMYVPTLFGTVDIINGFSVVKTVTVASYPTELGGGVYDEFNGKVYVTAHNSNVVYVLS